MGKMTMNGSAGGTGSDECTARLSDIPAGLKAVTADSNDEAGVGTMPDRGNWSAGDLAAGASVAIPAGKHGGVGKVTARSLAAQTSATAAAAQIRSGYSAWVNGQLVWGSLNIQSAINFSAAVVSYNQIKIVWHNPSTGPWEGVFIQMGTGGYPGSSGGTRVYTGVGSNAAAGGWSEVIIGGLNQNTTYYFTCTSYVNALGWGNSYNVSRATADSKIWIANGNVFSGYQHYGPYTIDDRCKLHCDIHNTSNGYTDRRKYYWGLVYEPSNNTGFNRSFGTISGDSSVTWSNGHDISYDKGKKVYVKFAPNYENDRGTITATIYLDF